MPDSSWRTIISSMVVNTPLPISCASAFLAWLSGEKTNRPSPPTNSSVVSPSPAPIARVLMPSGACNSRMGRFAWFPFGSRIGKGLNSRKGFPLFEYARYSPLFPTSDIRPNTEAIAFVSSASGANSSHKLFFSSVSVLMMK